VSGRLLEPQDSGGASTPHATATGGAWVHAPPPENPGKQGSVTASSPLPVLAGVTCKTPKNTTGSQFYFFFPLFSDLLLFLFFSVLDLLLSTDRFFSFSFPFFFVSGGGKTKGVAGC
jgi:hypothetical protein